jgi:hypothetical protein
LELRHQPNNADYEQQRPRRHKPRQDEKQNKNRNAIHGCNIFISRFLGG